MLLKLSEFAKKNNICYMTAYRWWKKDILNGIQHGKLILIDDCNPLKTGEDKSNQIEEEYITIKDSLHILENSNQSLGKQFSDIVKYLGLVTRNLR